MNRRQLLVATLTALGLWTLANVVVHRLAEQSLPRQLLAAASALPRIDILVAGNSVVREGFNAHAFEQGASSTGRKPAAFNLGLGGTTELEHLLLVQSVLRMHPEVQQLVYGVFDFHLTQPFVSRWWVADGNAALDFYVERLIAERYLTHGSWAERRIFRAVACLPFFVERLTLWSKIERMRRGLGGLGLPVEIVNSLGRVGDFEQLAARNETEFRENARRRTAERWPLAAPLVELFAACRQRGIEVLVVLMPLPPRHQGRFYSLPEWGAYCDYVRQMLTSDGIPFLDGTSWVTAPGKFHDAVHLNQEGASEFSMRLAREIVVGRTNRSSVRVLK